MLLSPRPEDNKPEEPTKLPAALGGLLGHALDLRALALALGSLSLRSLSLVKPMKRLFELHDDALPGLVRG